MISNIVNEIIAERNIGTKFGINEEKTNTNLISKHYSPLTFVKLRKYYTFGCNQVAAPLTIWCAVIADPCLDELKNIIEETLEILENKGLIPNSIQKLRDITGIVSETISTHYNSIKANTTEGIGIVARCGDLIVSNAYGDFMNHLSCRLEFYQLLNFAEKTNNDFES